MVSDYGILYGTMVSETFCSDIIDTLRTIFVHRYLSFIQILILFRIITKPAHYEYISHYYEVQCKYNFLFTGMKIHTIPVITV